MRLRKLAYLLLGAGILVLVAGAAFFLLPARDVSAQCGSQASSCKNCHETQAADPVNNDGTAWHSQHAFGDFCYLCHAGNNQVTDKVVAHTGLVAPLSDVDASCKSCHTNDTLAKANIYAATLGVTVGTGGNAAPVVPAATTAPAGNPTPAAVQAAVVPAAELVDYSQRYDELVLGKKPVNIGNLIALALIAFFVLGGGFFVAQREGLLKVSFEDPKKIAIKVKYPQDVVDMLPGLAKLKPGARKALVNILGKPAVAASLFESIDRYAQDEVSAESASTDEASAEPDEEND